MMKRIDDDAAKKIKQQRELLPGGNCRLRGNLWVRAAFKDSGLARVPRETQIRAALSKVITKKHLSSSLSDWESPYNSLNRNGSNFKPPKIHGHA